MVSLQVSFIHLHIVLDCKIGDEGAQLLVAEIPMDSSLEYILFETGISTPLDNYLFILKAVK